MSWLLDNLLPTLDSTAVVASLDGSGGVVASNTQFSWSPSYAVSKKTKLNMRVIQFGDGYQQRAGTGINNIGRQWDLRFNAKTETVAMDIQDFLEARKDGSSFYWKPPFLNRMDETIKVICKSFDIVPATYNSFDITATFEQVFGE